MRSGGSWPTACCRPPRSRGPHGALARPPDTQPRPRRWGPMRVGALLDNMRWHPGPCDRMGGPDRKGTGTGQLSVAPRAMGNRCVCTTGTAQSKAEVQSKSRRIKLFSDMSWAPFAVVNKTAGECCFAPPPLKVVPRNRGGGGGRGVTVERMHRGMVLSPEMRVIPGVRHPIPFLGGCYANDPRKGGGGAALDPTPSLRGDFQVPCSSLTTAVTGLKAPTTQATAT